MGLLTDETDGRVVIFDADTDEVLGTIDLAAGTASDCSIAGGQGLALVTASDSSVWVIDLRSSPPALAAGTNPVPISNTGRDTALTSDGRFLLTCGGGLPEPVSVIEVATRTEVDSFDPGHGCSTVEVCADGSVLIGFYNFDDNFTIVRRLVLDALGQLTDTGTTLVPDFPENLICAPGAETGLVLEIGGDARSFALPDLSSIENVPVFPGVAVSGQVRPARDSPSQDRLFVRSSDGANGNLAAFDYDSASGAIGDSSLFDVSLNGLSGRFGLDQMVLHPDGSKLYVPQPGTLEIYDPEDGELLSSIPDLSFTGSAGVCVGSGLFGDGFESGDATIWSSQTP